MEGLLTLLINLLSPGNGIELTRLNSFTFESWLPFWTFSFLAAGIAAGSYVLYLRAAPRVSRTKQILLTVFRTLAMIGLLTCLARPELVIEGEGVRKGTVPVVVDGTQSMNIRDIEDAERVVAAKRETVTLLQESEKRSEVTLQAYWAGREFGEFQTEETQEANADQTSLSQMMEQGITPYLGEYIPGMILVTDGAHNVPQSVERMTRVLRKRNVPVYTLGVGTTKADDIAITYLIGDDVVFLTEEAKTFVNVTQSGFDGQSVRVTLSLDDREVYFGKHTLSPGETSIPIEYQPFGTGTYQMRAEIQPLAGEITEENNTYLRTIRVIDEQMRILLIFGNPSWEYRYLAGAFERDKRVTFEVYMNSVDSRLFTEGDGGHFIQELPETAEEIGQTYDAIFLSGTPPSELPEGFVEGLPEFVENAGGFAVIADPAFIPHTMEGTAMEPLLPIIPGRVAPRAYRDELFAPLQDPVTFDLTDDGDANPLVLFSGNAKENREIWQNLPPIYRYYPAARLKPSALTLLVTFENEQEEEFPAIVLQSYGKGSVLYMGFDSSWRWRKEYGDRYFRDFWGKAVQYLALPHLLNEAAQSVILAGQETAYTGEKVNIRAKLSNADFSPYTGGTVPMTVTLNEDRRDIDLFPISGRPGMYRGEVVPDTNGTLKLALPERFNAKPLELRVMTQQREFRNAELNERLLQEISDTTGGLFFNLEDADELLEALIENRPRQSVRIARSLWDSPLLFLFILLFLTSEWVLRKTTYLD